MNRTSTAAARPGGTAGARRGTSAFSALRAARQVRAARPARGPAGPAATGRPARLVPPPYA